MLTSKDKAALLSLFTRLDANTDLVGEDLERHLNDFCYARSPAEVPERHRAALKVFQELSNMEQAAVVREYCGTYDSSRGR